MAQILGLTNKGCKERQARFLKRLDEAGIPAAVISAPRDIYYFTGVLPENKSLQYPNVLFFGPGQKSWLVTGLENSEPLVDEVVSYPTGVLYTLNPDNVRRMCALLPDLIRRTPNFARLGFQREEMPHAVYSALNDAGTPGEWVEIDDLLQEQQLRKDADEIACIRNAVRATLAGYSRAQQVVQPGVTELDVMTECQMAAQRFSRCVHFYNGDFQSANFGGQARDRKIEAGELYIIDAWSDIDGYWCDMARTWSVGEPTDLQASVYEQCAAVLKAVPEMAKPGRCTMDFWRELDARLREHPHLAETGLVHHGGHGVGLRVHEFPDLNRDRGGVFEVGNVFTCEPGAYSDVLNRGVRVENVFEMTEDGARVLVPYPLSVHKDPNCPVPA